MFDESRLLAFIRALYQYEKGGCDTCTEHDGYGCSHPGNCEWHWDYAEDLKEFEIPEEVVTMELKKAIEILDGCIPHPSNKMVDREHLDIAIAWSVIKAELSAKPKEDEGKGAGARLFDLICEGLPDYSEGRIWTTYDEIMVKDAETAKALADIIELYARSKGEEIVVNTGYYDPAEDKRNGEEDRHTGWHYVNIG